MSKNDDSTGGYGKPPPEHRFKKGKSGNPKGRPRKVKKTPEPPKFRDGILGSLLEQEAFRTLQLHENGKPVEITAAEAVMRSIIIAGMKGNRLDKKFAFQTLRQEEKEALERSTESYLFWSKKKAEGAAKIALHEKEGVALPRLYPHPDDILLDETKIKVHILGPMNKDQAIPFEKGALARDWYLAYSVYEEKLGKVTTFEWDGKSGTSSIVLAMLIDDSLPPSFRMDEWSMTGYVMKLQNFTKRKILQRLKTLITQIGATPESIEEQLARQARAANVVDIVGDGLEKALAEFAEKI
mgnify:CR=1 FL=1|jgi:hypothetical protein